MRRLSIRCFNFGAGRVTSILGISAVYDDSAVCLVVNGEIVAAAQEEGFTRIKRDHNFPLNATRCCLKEAGLAPDQHDYVGYDKPLLKSIDSRRPISTTPFWIWFFPEIHAAVDERKAVNTD